MINIQNISDRKSFKWCLVRYLHPTYHNQRRIINVDKLYGNKLDFKDIKSNVKVKDVCLMERKNSIGISVFSYKDKKKYSIYVSKNVAKINMWIYY